MYTHHYEGVFNISTSLKHKLTLSPLCALACVLTTDTIVMIVLWCLGREWNNINRDSLWLSSRAMTARKDRAGSPRPRLARDIKSVFTPLRMRVAFECHGRCCGRYYGRALCVMCSDTTHAGRTWPRQWCHTRGHTSATELDTVLDDECFRSYCCKLKMILLRLSNRNTLLFN